MQGVVDQLETNETQNHGQAVRQVNQALQQPVNQEEQLAQAQQRESVSGHHQVGLLG